MLSTNYRSTHRPTRQLEIAPHSKYAAVELALLLKSNWDRQLGGGTFSTHPDGGGGNDAGVEGGERLRDWGEEARFWFERAVR